ncbi:MAG: sulfur carrier protein ThiS [Candidatus Xiphinematobacter sp.]|nr:MAG: sulfur carrier protein ThiS [Candidatus Xiphinematobacter sp.]
MSTIWINGEELKNVNASTVEELMKELEVSPITLVEHNGKALHRAEWSTMPIRPGDHLELLYLTAGR